MTTQPMQTIAALYVQKNGVYFGLDGVDPWDESRDARLYAGPHPVVAHPPCQRWGRYWSGGPMLARTPKAKQKGDDDGCFASAIVAVRKYGGVLEHPEASHAWLAFGLLAPPRYGGWMPSGSCGAGHRFARLDDGFYTKEERRKAQKRGTLSRLSKAQRAATPEPFRDVLLALARGAT